MSESAEAIASSKPSDDLLRVQQSLGRCLLRIQQYELLMKALLANHRLKGHPVELERIRDQQAVALANKSLGLLVDRLFDTYVISDQLESVAPDEPAEVFSIDIRANMQMAEANRLELEQSIRELVGLRNDLVHHFVEQFDLYTAGGRGAAITHLERSYGQIDAHFVQLRGWVAGMENARALMASFVQSQAFTDDLVDGIGVDGAIRWRDSGIVEALREATAALAVNGWTKLSDAVAYMLEKHPDQTPDRYGCRSWGQVLNDSGLFVINYRPTATATSAKVGWFRERPLAS